MASGVVEAMDPDGLEIPTVGPQPLNHCDSNPPNGPLNWSETLFPNMRPPRKFNLRFIPPKTRDEKVIGVCQKTAVEGELVVLDLTLVGFFLGRKPSFSFVRAALLKQWKLQGNVEIIQMIQGGYAFRFSDLRDRDAILEGDAYFVGGQPMFLRAWERSLHSGGILGLRKIPLWISLPGLPLHLWGEEALSSICSVLGIPLYADRNTALKSRLVYARVCVEFLGDKPLLDSITIEDEVGMIYEQKVIYDWKPPHCLTCGVFGHGDCGVKGKNKEPVVNSIEIASDMDTNCEEPQHNSVSDASLLEAGTGRKSCETLKEGDDDEGWEHVRVRKKKSDGYGAPKAGVSRPGREGVIGPGREGVIGGSYGLSTPHWRKRDLQAGQVRQTAPLPRLENFLNFKYCPSSVSGPPSYSGKSCPDGSFANSPTEPLINPKPNAILEDSPTGSIEPVNHTNRIEPMNHAPNSETSAGHTPYPNRLATLARELRRRQVGKAGLRHSEFSGPLNSGETHGDMQPSPLTTLTVDLNHEVPGRSGNGPSVKHGEDGNAGNQISNIADELGGHKEDSAMKNKDIQKDRDPYCRKDTNLKLLNHHRSGNELKRMERKDAEANQIGRDNGEGGQVVDLGHGMAKTH